MKLNNSITVEEQLNSGDGTPCIESRSLNIPVVKKKSVDEMPLIKRECLSSVKRLKKHSYKFLELIILFWKKYPHASVLHSHLYIFFILCLTRSNELKKEVC
jgi:hypothetical protein